jgi:hypothetical protein
MNWDPDHVLLSGVCAHLRSSCALSLRTTRAKRLEAYYAQGWRGDQTSRAKITDWGR